ncbi:MAG: hypothetical protein J6N52_10650 [Clostridia bacterium]|nr:hypothetical protein [Clostridia bacterium]
MKKLIVIGGAAIIFILLMVICYKAWLPPVKYALKQEDLANIETPYFLVQWTQVTGSSWMIVGDQDGYYDNAKYVIANGETPSVVQNYDVATGHNTYVCYGSYVGETEIPGGEILSEYQFTGWDILYPVKRNMPISLLPKSYLCKFDY